MPDHLPSLLHSAERQPEFSLTGEGGEVCQAAEAQGDYTAARLFSRRPDAYKAVIGLSAEGRGALRIAALLGVSVHTVLAVRSREGVAIDQERRELADRFRAGAKVAAEAALDAVADPDQRSRCNALQLATAAAILTDKAELLSGSQPSIRIEVEHRASPTQFADLVREAAARMDSRAEGERTKGGEPIDAERGPGGVWAPVGGPAEALDGIDSVAAGVASDCAATVAPDDACGDACGGPGGGAENGGSARGQAGADGGGGGRARDGGAIT